MQLMADGGQYGAVLLALLTALVFGEEENMSASFEFIEVDLN